MSNPAKQNKFHIVVISFLVVFFVCALALPSEASQDALPEKALEAVTKGLAAVRAEDYELAIKYFSEAYESGAQDSQAVHLNLALAYDKAGGRELMSIAWYRVFLAGFTSVPEGDVSNERLKQIRQRVIDLDIQTERVIRRLIKIAEEAVKTLAPNNRKVYLLIAEAQAAIGDLGAADKSLRLAYQSEKKRLSRPRSVGYASSFFEQPVISIALSHWKHGDPEGATRIIDWAISEGYATSTGSTYRHYFVYKKALNPIRMFINRDWSGLQKENIFFLGHPGNVKDGGVETRLGGFGTTKWDEVARALFVYHDSFGKLKILDGSCWEYGAITVSSWTKVARCNLNPGQGSWWLYGFKVDEDWRDQAKAAETKYASVKIVEIMKLARGMAHLQHFHRKYAEYLKGE